MVIALLLTVGLLLAHYSCALRSIVHTKEVAAAMTTPHLQMDEGQARLLPGFASHGDEGNPQPWVEQGTTAMALRVDDNLAGAAPAEDAVSDTTMLTQSQPRSSHVNAAVDMASAAAAQGQSAAGYPAATACKPSPEKEPAASSGWFQSDGLGSASSQHDGSMQQDALSSLSTEQSCVSCSCEPAAEHSLRDAASAHTTAPIAAATAVEPASGDLVDLTSTEHAVVVPDESQLVCVPAAHSVSAPEVAVWGRLAVGGFVSPATAAAARESDATLTDGIARAEFGEDSSLLKPAEPFHASRLDIQADTDALAAAADSTDKAATGSSQSNDAAAANRKLQECSSAVATSTHPELAVALDEPFMVLPSQEDEPHVTSITIQTAVNQAQAATSETVTPPSAEEGSPESSPLNSPIESFSQPDIDPEVPLAAEMQPMEQDQPDNAQDLPST